MEKLLKRNNWSLFFLLLICSCVYFVVGIKSVKDAHADETWGGTPGSYRTWRMGNIEKELKEIKSKLEALALRKEGYIKSNADNIRSRLTKKYNEDVAALDQELVDDYNRYKARPENRNLAEGVTKSEWRRTSRAKDLLAATELRKRQLRVDYFADLKKLEKGTLRSGLDNVFDGIAQEQNVLLLRQRELNEELRFLKTHTEEEAKARRDRLISGFEFRVSVIGNTVRNVNIGDTEEVELAIPTGTMPLTLEIIAEDGSKEVKTLTRSGRLILPFRFTMPGNKTRLFIVTDSSIPRSSSTANVMFIVLDNTAPTPPTTTPAPTGDNQGPDISVTSHNDDPALAWTHVTTRTITLSGTATDFNRGGNGIQSVYIDSSLADSGSMATGNATANWSKQLSLSSGWNRITIDAYDNSPAYNKTSKTIMIYFDAPDAPDTRDATGYPSSSGTGRQPSAAFTAEFDPDCAGSFELEPGNFVGKLCNIIVKGWSHNNVPVTVTVVYDESSEIEVWPGDQSQHPMNMFNTGVSDYYDRYIFSEHFKARSTASPGLTAVTITVSQPGTGTVVLTLTISVLPEGQLPSSGSGIRPPAEVAVGSATGPDAYCVWRYKMFGDRPECFNFVSAVCDTPMYTTNDRYELVGSGMTPLESSVRMSQLSSYGSDAYGCHRRSEQTGDGEGEEEGQVDNCPADPDKTGPGMCGCGHPDIDSDGDGIYDCQELTCTGDTEEFNGRCVPKCGTGYSRDESGNCVFDPIRDVASRGGHTCLSNDECPEKHLCVNYRCIPEDALHDANRRARDWQGGVPESSSGSGAAGGGEPQGQGEYGKPTERETRECEGDSECQYGQTCQEGKCVASVRPDYPPYPPHTPPPDDGVGEGRDWTDWATSGQKPTGGPEPKEPGYKPKPKTKTKTTTTQSSTPTGTGKGAGCRWSGTFWPLSGLEWKCYCSGKESKTTKPCGPYPPPLKKKGAQKVDGSKFGLDVWYGMWDKANNRCILWGKDAVVINESECGKFGMK